MSWPEVSPERQLWLGGGSAGLATDGRRRPARVFTTNAASRAVHRSAGFEEVGIQRRHGRLDGGWRDCVLVERLLGDTARA
jgi:L-amino acid N-acyltransferase YncA